MGIVTTFAVAEGFTADDLDDLPDDGQRYELVDGLLLVTPSPRERHQRVQFRLGIVLDRACPAGLRVYTAPLDVRFSLEVQVQPDVLVVPDQPPRDELGPVVPLLVVEVLSPSTRRVDQGLKRRAYERAGVPSYWLVDPLEPRLTALELVDGRYARVADVVGEQVWRATKPYGVEVRPADLLR